MSVAVRKYSSSTSEFISNLHLAFLEAGWQFWDEYDEEKVYRSNGEEGIFPYIYVRIYYSSTTVYIELYLYWDIGTHTGTVLAQGPVYGKYISTYESGYSLFSGDRDLFGVSSGYDSNSMVLGFCNKLFYPDITNLTSSASSGDNVNLEVASSSGIVKGQRVQIVGVDTEGRDQLQVTDVPDSTHVTVLNLPRDYASGAFLGVTPCPAFRGLNYNSYFEACPLCPSQAAGTEDILYSVRHYDTYSAISNSYLFPDNSSYFNLIPSRIIKGRSTEDYESLIGIVDHDFVKIIIRDEDSGRNQIWTIGVDGFPEQGTVTSATSNTITDSTKNWTINELVGYNVLIVDGEGQGNSRKIVSNTSDTLTLITQLEDTPDATSVYRIVDTLYRNISFYFLKEETQSFSLSSCSSSSSSGSSSSRSSSSRSSSSSSISISSSSSSSSLSSSSSSSSVSVSSSSSSRSSSSSSKSFSSATNSFSPASNGDDGYVEKISSASYDSLTIDSATGTFTEPTLFDWATPTASWEFRFNGNEHYDVYKDDVYIQSAYTTDTQHIIGSFDYPQVAVFGSNFGGTFYDGDTITFNTTEANLDFNSYYQDVDGYRLKCSNDNDWFVKFDNVTVPEGSIITNAYVTVTAFSNSNIDDSSTTIRGVFDIPPTTGTLYYHDINREKGNETIEWTLPAFTEDSTYDSPDISSIIQEFIDTDWTSGDDILLYFYDGGSVEKEVNSFEETSGYAQLHIEYLA